MKIPIVVGVDRAGLVGGDGCTHQGIFDIALLRSLPGVVILAPKDENELQHMIYTGVRLDKTVFIRYPKEPGQGVVMDSELKDIPFAKSEIVREGKDALVLAVGPLVPRAIEAAEILAGSERIDLTVVNVRYVKPLDKELILKYTRKLRKVITLEDGVRDGGFGTMVQEMLRAENVKRYDMLNLGVPEEIVAVASREELLDKYNLTGDAIAREISEFLKKKFLNRILRTGRVEE